MDAGASFCRLMLGDTVAATDAARASAIGVDAVDTVAGAWLACAPELGRRRDSLSWEEPHQDPALGPVVAGLAALADRERAAVIAQAVGLTAAELPAALGLEPGEGPALLARGHAGLAGLERPADPGCAAEREALAADEARRGRASTGHCDTCRAFAAALAEQRPALRKAARRAPPGAGTAARRTRLHVAFAPNGPLARRGQRVLEPRGRAGRTAVAVLVTVAAGAAGFGLVRVLEGGERRPGDSGQVTATPVEPLPPAVNQP